jgi:hypothetical protein
MPVPLDAGEHGTAGACDPACGSGEFCLDCAGASCQPSGSICCDGTISSLQFDDVNCGACGNACPSGQTCLSAQCTCNPAVSDCSDGAVDAGEDAGACDPPCGADQTCIVDCGGITSCEPARSSCCVAQVCGPGTQCLVCPDDPAGSCADPTASCPDAGGDAGDGSTCSPDNCAGGCCDMTGACVHVLEVCGGFCGLPEGGTISPFTASCGTPGYTVPCNGTVSGSGCCPTGTLCCTTPGGGNVAGCATVP